MDPFFERLIVRAATIDELLSDDFEALPGQKSDVDLAARRLASWCRSCASGDWLLFGRRLERDGWSIGEALARFATVRRKASALRPTWIDDAIWIDLAVRQSADNAHPISIADVRERYAFEELLNPIVEQAEALLWSNVDRRVFGTLTESARTCLRRSLLKELCELCAPAIYERFLKARKSSETVSNTQNPRQTSPTSRYDQFVTEMKTGGFRHLCDEKPVLLRLIAVMTRQWIDRSRELVLRLDADLPNIKRDILRCHRDNSVCEIQGDLSDPHNNGRSVQIVTFTDKTRVVYKPKDLRLDVAWHRLVDRLNRSDPPTELRALRAIAIDGYGWTEFIEHEGCDGQQGFKHFFRRAGAWLALFHCFAANDMHQENMIAAGEQPIPIDIETILQSSAAKQDVTDPEAEAFETATEILANSVMMVGLLPAYGRSPDNRVFAIGGLTADWSSKIKISWENINSDEMRPTKLKYVSDINPNLPHIDGRYAKLADHLDDFISGFEDYAKFLLRHNKHPSRPDLYADFVGLPVRKVVRATRFYSMLLQRLKNHRTMDDGVLWSAQADFVARLAEWDTETDIFWPLQRAERAALLRLNVPYFVSLSDTDEVVEPSGLSTHTQTASGIDRARTRLQQFDDREIAWQLEVIKENSRSFSNSSAATEMPKGAKIGSSAGIAIPADDFFVAEANKVAEELAHFAIRRGPGAAWIGLDWLGDAEVFQLVCLGPDLYNGVSGISVFLAAHAAVTRRHSSSELALAGISHVRKNLRSRNAARIARSLGLGGATGLGSIVYALTIMSKYLRDESLLADAHVAAELFTDDLIDADKHLDVIGGSAGAILCLLRLYRDSQSEDVLRRATKCGEHLISQSRLGTEGLQSWIGQGLGERALNGMSHGAAGFAYALAALSSATEREDFAKAASECIAFENSSYDGERHNWPDFRGSGEPTWPCQWCHGAPGIGLARIATTRLGGMDKPVLTDDIRNAVEAATRGWPGSVDTLCCGTLGNVEFFCEASSALGRDDLREVASQRLKAVIDSAKSSGDYRWNSGKSRFNLGLFRGIAGVGYTALRRVDPSLSNVLIWE